MNKKLWKSRIENFTVFQETMPMPDRHLGLACSETGHGRAPYCGCHEGTRDYAPSLGLQETMPMPDHHLGLACSETGHGRAPYCGCHQGTRDYAPSLGLRLLQ